MHRDLISKLQNIIQFIRSEQDIDFTALPIQQVLGILESARRGLAGLGYSPIEALMTLIDCAIRSGDKEELCAVLQMICVCLDDIDQMIARSKLSSSYLDILTRRIPEYLYLRNIERKEIYHKTHPEASHYQFAGKGVVYTIVIGGYDVPQAPLVKNYDWDYLLFTDNISVASAGWEIVQLPRDESLSSARYSRKPKILCHEFLDGYDYSIYIDGNVRITGDLREYISKYSTGESMLCLNHYINCDAYEEAELCKENRRDDPSVIDAQMSRYRSAGFPADFGLTANCFLIRNHRDERLQKVMNDWWQELLQGSYRDQLSFTYCCWKNDYVFDTSPLFQSDNPYIQTEKHQSKS